MHYCEKCVYFSALKIYGPDLCLENEAFSKGIMGILFMRGIPTGHTV